MEASCLPDREAGLQLHRCADRMAEYGLGDPSIGRHGLAYRLFTSGSNASLASIDEFDRTRNLSHRRTGRVVLVVRSSRRRYYLVGYLGRVCVHRVCGRDAQRSSTSAGVLIRVSGASSIIVSDQFAQQTRITQPHRKPELPAMLHFVSNEVAALLQVIMIDLVLAGDNAIVIGLAAAGLPLQQRTKAVLVGIIAATVLRITFAAATTQLLQVVGLVLAGGILLLWVSWKMFRELRLSAEGRGDAIEAMSNMDINADGTIASHAPRKSFSQAASQIVVADVSMSLDNVLAVAGAAQEHFTVLIVGLGLSVALMGIAAGYIARLLHRHQWIAYAGLLVILYVAVEMIYRGVREVWPLITHS